MNITSPRSIKEWITIGYISMNITIGAHELKQGNIEPSMRGLKERALNGLPIIHASVVPVWSATGIIHKLQALRSGHASSELSENNPIST